MLFVAIVVAASQNQDDDLLSALNKRRSEVAERISDIVGRSSDGVATNNDEEHAQEPAGRSEETVTPNQESTPPKPASEDTAAVVTVTEEKPQQQGENEVLPVQTTQRPQRQRPISSLVNRLTSLFGRREVNIDATRSLEITNLINEQIAIDEEIRRLESSVQGKASSQPLYLYRNNLGEYAQGRQAGNGDITPDLHRFLFNRGNGNNGNNGNNGKNKYNGNNGNNVNTGNNGNTGTYSKNKFNRGNGNNGNTGTYNKNKFNNNGNTGNNKNKNNGNQNGHWVWVPGTTAQDTPVVSQDFPEESPIENQFNEPTIQEQLEAIVAILNDPSTPTAEPYRFFFNSNRYNNNGNNGFNYNNKNKYNNGNTGNVGNNNKPNKFGQNSNTGYWVYYPSKPGTGAQDFPEPAVLNEQLQQLSAVLNDPSTPKAEPYRFFFNGNNGNNRNKYNNGNNGYNKNKYNNGNTGNTVNTNGNTGTTNKFNKNKTNTQNGHWVFVPANTAVAQDTQEVYTEIPEGAFIEEFPTAQNLNEYLLEHFFTN